MGKGMSDKNNTSKNVFAWGGDRGRKKTKYGAEGGLGEHRRAQDIRVLSHGLPGLLVRKKALNGFARGDQKRRRTGRNCSFLRRGDIPDKKTEKRRRKGRKRGEGSPCYH